MKRSSLPFAVGALAAAALCAVIGAGAHAGTPGAATGGDANAAAVSLDPREAGARYGQAMGVALVCYGLRTTPATDRLKAKYSGADQDAFQTEAEKVLSAWREASTCQSAGGPNACRLAHEWSCQAALREIGPRGSKLPGLITEKTSS
jgi:hypothetical protein